MLNIFLPLFKTGLPFRGSHKPFRSFVISANHFLVPSLSVKAAGLLKKEYKLGKKQGHGLTAGVLVYTVMLNHIISQD